MQTDPLVTFLGAAWREHGHAARSLVDRFDQALELLAAEDRRETRFEDVARLIEHVLLGHLGKPQLLRGWIDRLAALAPRAAASQRALERLHHAVAVAEGRIDPFELQIGDAANACLGNALVSAWMNAGGRHAKRCVDVLAGQLDGADPVALRRLGAVMNSLSFHLGLLGRPDALGAAMVRAARVSCDAWQRAGDWKEHERAEYLAATACAAAGWAGEGLVHAAACRTLCVAHDAPAYEHFFAAEAACRCHAVAGDREAAEQEWARMGHWLERLQPTDDEAHCRQRMAAAREALDACASVGALVA